MLHDSELSELSSPSEELCLRLPMISGTGTAIGVIVDCAGGLGLSCWVIEGAEGPGYREAGEFGVDGPAEVTGEGAFGGVSPARTNDGPVPALLQVEVAVALYGLEPLCWTHQTATVCVGLGGGRLSQTPC